MRIPRDVSGARLVKALQRIGYVVTRQSGSHIRIETDVPSTHRITIPNHDPLKIGTFAGILDEIARHLKIDRKELLERLKL